MNNSLQQEKNKMKEEMNTKIEIQMKKIQKTMSIQQRIFEFKFQNKIEVKMIQDILGNLKWVLDESLFKFSSMQTLYSGLCSKILKIDNENPILNSANKVIGKILETQDEIKEFFNLISLLNHKIAEKKFVGSYYEAFKKVLTGSKWNSELTYKNYKRVLFIYNI